MRKLAALLFLSLLLGTVAAQQVAIPLRIETVHWEGFPRLQSFAAATWQGKWIFMGGRTDGLHLKQPFAAFHPQYNNTSIYVADPQQRRIWQAPVTTLPVALAEQLQSTNMQFVQQGDKLYLFGGYGFSESKKQFITHPQLTLVALPQLVAAMEQGTSFEHCFTTITDERFAVTGGGVGYMDGRFYLVGGQKFTGRYNPHGPTHGPGFVQQYTNAIRSFQIRTTANTISVENYTEQRDSVHLHRRDYNLVPQHFGAGTPGFTVFAGVFRYDADLPWLYPVDVYANHHQAQPQLEQRYSHYHSAYVPIWSASAQQMHTLFFGGIAQYYVENGTDKKDNDVPFVNTISQVTRSGNQWQELALPVQLPGLLGTSAWFAVHPTIPQTPHHIIDWDVLPAGEQLLGYIVGGIESSVPNIFWPNNGSQSKATSTLLAVYATKAF